MSSFSSPGNVGGLLAANNLSDVASSTAAVKNLQAGYVLSQSAVQVAHTGDTSVFTFATISVPANAIGANGRIEVVADFSSTGSSGTKTCIATFGGSQMFAAIIATSGSAAYIDGSIMNRNATNSQRFAGQTSNSNNNIGDVSGTLAIDTTAIVNITITGQLSIGTDTVRLESYKVIIYPHA